MQVFNTDGEFLLKFGSNGEGNGQFNAPTGVAVDVNGNIIVADWGNSRIQVSIKAVVNMYVAMLQPSLRANYYHLTLNNAQVMCQTIILIISPHITAVHFLSDNIHVQ